MKAELKKANKRISDIDTILAKLYEDRALGKITEARYLQMTPAYDKEYAELQELVAELEQTIKACEEAMDGVRSFAKLLKKYTEITELDAKLLNELIEKIVVHEKEEISGQIVQRVDIYYKFVGMI